MSYWGNKRHWKYGTESESVLKEIEQDIELAEGQKEVEYIGHGDRDKAIKAINDLVEQEVEEALKAPTKEIAEHEIEIKNQNEAYEKEVVHLQEMIESLEELLRGQKEAGISTHI